MKSLLSLAPLSGNKILLIIRKQDPFIGTRDLIVCPKKFLSGLKLAFQRIFNHASKSQLKQLFNHYFHAVGSSRCIYGIVDDCSLCNSFKEVPKELFTKRTSVTTAPGKPLSADVMFNSGQKGFVVKDVLTSFTSATFTKMKLLRSYIKLCLLCVFRCSFILQ